MRKRANRRAAHWNTRCLRADSCRARTTSGPMRKSSVVEGFAGRTQRRLQPAGTARRVIATRKSSRCDGDRWHGCTKFRRTGCSLSRIAPVVAVVAAVFAER